MPIEYDYRILNTMLPIGFLEPMLMETLAMYERGEDLLESPYAKWGLDCVEKRKWWYGVERFFNKEQGVRERLDKVIELLESFKKHGYSEEFKAGRYEGSPIWVFFKQDGQVEVYDGFHRLCMMKYLGL